MDTPIIPTPPSLTDRLRAAAGQWVSANEASLARLGRLVVNDGAFFTKLDTMPRGPSTDTLEKFARFLADPANWPDGAVAEEARALAHVVGVSLPDAAGSAGNPDDLSGALRDDASTGSAPPQGERGRAAA